MKEYFANRYFSITVLWHNRLIRSIALGYGIDGFCPGLNANPYSARIAQAMRRYESRQRFDWAEPPLDWSLIASDFRKNVLQVLFKNTSFGQTVSYSQLAAMAGSPGGARAAGLAMSSNPWPVIIPCHRVIRASGKIGGFSSGHSLKRILLSLEGKNFPETVAKKRADD